MCEDEGEVRATMRLEPYPYSTGTERFRLYSRPISEERRWMRPMCVGACVCPDQAMDGCR